ncbi:unnamed protein product [Rhizoctonia solani]|uniref:O-methylsterigmatocystin oxidoreductase n=1 Tax=Rhizoctonia solani TaxID=456999 RepID=A0A8H3CTY9_9AGAM|nr:unnamed protein product [Rhizoctonia solani]
MDNQGMLFVGCIVPSIIVWILSRTVKSQLSLPPGPSGHWLWGNIAEINVLHRPVKAATEWKELYGDIMCLRTISNTTVIVNSEALVMELLEKRAGETSDRPRNVFVRELMGWNTSTVLQQHNNRHRQLRKTMALVLQQSQARTYSSLHSSNLLHFLRAVAKTPEDYMNHIDDSASRFIMNLAYGHEIVEDDPLVAAVRAGQIYMEDGLATHRWVNSFPFLRYYPAWAPGGEFQKVAREGLRRRLEFANVPFNTVMDKIQRNEIVRPSFTSRLLEQKGGINASEEDVDLIKWSAAALFGGGTATVTYYWCLLSFVWTDVFLQRALMHDSVMYPDPYNFNPDRFLKSTPDTDPRRFLFGFGRRVCPGQHVANNSALTMCAAFMSVFDIVASQETTNKAAQCAREPWKMMKPYGPMEPMPFGCTIRPRDDAAVAVLETCKDTAVIA